MSLKDELIEGEEAWPATRLAKIDRTRTSGDLLMCEECLRNCCTKLYSTYLEAFGDIINGVGDSDRGCELDDADVDVFIGDLHRVLVPLIAIGKELAKWTAEVEELIENDFEFATSPFASNADETTNPSKTS